MLEGWKACRCRMSEMRSMIQSIPSVASSYAGSVTHRPSNFPAATTPTHARALIQIPLPLHSTSAGIAPTILPNPSTKPQSHPTKPHTPLTQPPQTSPHPSPSLRDSPHPPPPSPATSQTAQTASPPRAPSPPPSSPAPDPPSLLPQHSTSAP